MNIFDSWTFALPGQLFPLFRPVNGGSSVIVIIIIALFIVINPNEDVLFYLRMLTLLKS